MSRYTPYPEIWWNVICQVLKGTKASVVDIRLWVVSSLCCLGLLGIRPLGARAVCYGYARKCGFDWRGWSVFLTGRIATDVWLAVYTDLSFIRNNRKHQNKYNTTLWIKHAIFDVFRLFTQYSGVQFLNLFPTNLPCFSVNSPTW